MNVRTKLVVAVLAVGLLATAYWLLHDTGTLSAMLDNRALHARLDRWGPWGPAAIMALMMLAILISPIPSAPIALAAGAAYGHGWGTLYVLVGAEIGALLAFSIARWLGYDAVHRWFGSRLSVGLAGSQNALTGLVLVSRLLPFVSFDIVSYAAGLTVLSFWRFALATLAGIAPSSFLLAHFGMEMGSGEGPRVLYSVLALGGLGLLPIVAKLVIDRRARRQAVRDPGSG